MPADAAAPHAAPPASAARPRARDAWAAPARLGHRAEIDGLRAVAVLPVILFHAGVPGFAGGYVGVDVFFVISGYLIASLLIAERAGTGRIDLPAFWARRARRILPALYLVMAASAGLAWAWMLPDPLENFGQSLVAATLFANNVLLTLTAGYWDLSAEFKPLLHSWSLGVEEQFYLLFPLLLAGLWRLGPRGAAAILAALALASLAAAELLLARAPQAAFYLLPARAWEILAGVLAALALARGAVPAPPPRRAAAAGLAGLGLIAAAVLGFDAATPVPGLPALVPVAGTLLVILHARPGTPAARLLSLRPVVGLGLISYSAYLWHQPLLAFARIHGREAPSPALLAALVGLTLLLAWLSWRFVERPFRDPARIPGRPALALGLAASAALLAGGWALHASHGAPGRLAGAAEAGGRHIAYNESVFALEKPAFEDPGAVNLLVLGHSFARDFVNMTRETFGTQGLEIAYSDAFQACLDPADPAQARLLAGADVVVIAAGRERDPACAQADLAAARAAGAALFWAGPKVFGDNLNWLVRLDPAARAQARNPLPRAMAARDAALARRLPAGRYLSLMAPLTAGGAGVRLADAQGRLLSADRDHLTRAGARWLGRAALAGSPFAAHMPPPG